MITLFENAYSSKYGKLGNLRLLFCLHPSFKIFLLWCFILIQVHSCVTMLMKDESEKSCSTQFHCGEYLFSNVSYAFSAVHMGCVIIIIICYYSDIIILIMIMLLHCRSYINQPEFLREFLNPLYEPNEDVLKPSIVPQSLVSLLLFYDHESTDKFTN